MTASLPDRQRRAVYVCLSLMLAGLCLITHRYYSLTHDAQIYTFQAFAKLHPALGNDLFFQHTSQDHYTYFPDLYALVIKLLGVETSPLVLTGMCTAWFLAAAWWFARGLSGADSAWLAVALLILVGGGYGGSGVFHFSENFISARLMAEAMVATAFACCWNDRRAIAWMLIAASFCIHPLMTLPGMLLLLGAALPLRAFALCMLAGVSATGAIALAAVHFPAAARLFPVMDPEWVTVVRERSQFLFLQLWQFRDWRLNGAPFLSLAISAAVLDDERLRKLSLVAALVGAAGLLCALLASTVGPVAILLQAQTWRWVWITKFLCLVLVVPTIMRMRRDERCGLLCALLLLLGWLYIAVDGLELIVASLVLWLARKHIGANSARYLRWAGMLVAVVIVLWALANVWTGIRSALPESGLEPAAVQRLRTVFGLQIPGAVAVYAIWAWARSSRRLAMPACVSVVLFGCVLYVAPSSFKQLLREGSPGAIREFTAWRAAIPPSSTVVVADGANSGSFVWFTLQRPNYLSPGQSAGVVFSAEAAHEIVRRSQVLLPIEDPDWRIYTELQNLSLHKPSDLPASWRPLTVKALLEICSDPLLGFVVSKENVGFDPLTHTANGQWKGWNLYNCGRVREDMSTT